MQSIKPSVRLSYVDFLKTVGLLCIILAHVDAPDWLKMIRSFDVPLMVLLSAILAQHAGCSTETTWQSMTSYLIKRVKRLVFPTWLFLIFFFCVNIIIGNVHDTEYYIQSFLLTRYGIGYVWIVLIYLYCAAMVPLIHHAGNKKSVWFSLVIVYLLYEAAYFMGIGVENRFILSTIYYIIPYGILTAIGYHYSSMKFRTKIIICGTSVLLFVLSCIGCMLVSGKYQPVSAAKYPPRIYFLSFCVAISFFLLMLCEKRDAILFRSKVVCFFSRHSFWIYLWHIFYIHVCAVLIDKAQWLLQYLLIVIFSCLTAWIQDHILNWFAKKLKWKIPTYLRG